MKVKCLSLHQPWASLLFLDRPLILDTSAPREKCKQYETRIWAPKNVPQTIYIHASKNRTMEGEHLIQILKVDFPLVAKAFDGKPLQYGVILGSVTIREIEKTADAEPHIDVLEFALGNFEKGRYAWRLENAVLLPAPIPARGRQGFWHQDI